ncbi:transmembrane inner ear expressed protein [Hermetia illucens]|uniref:transmembrane inner ear expressed protein n=1 Tax=Hermetia illucens TaxID=343691 RepID=UPI0018CBF4B0|nr:transmembrane inner ear expressed protein [Hermetia illucens]XP_037903548.1 transmembrane inner ear expressed protein [Hermetia illucens]
MNLESTELDVEFEVDPETAWLEEITIGDFRIWHIMFFAFCGFMCIVIVLCCCFRIRIPRTKQDIEADYKRKRITRKFREKMALMKNSDMDGMDLQKALAKIQAEFLAEAKNSDDQRLIQDTMQTITNRSTGNRKIEV